MLWALYRKVRRILQRAGLARWIPRCLIPLGSYLRSRGVVIHGHKMFLDEKDALGILERGTFEPNETRFLEGEIRPGDVVADVGANIGYYTLLFARLAGPQGHVYAFEPDASNVDVLRKNVAANGYQNVTIVPKAVLDVTGPARLYPPDFATQHSTHPAGMKQQSVEIEAVRLDDYFRGYEGRLDFIKLDIEGAEEKAVRGMEATLRRHPAVRLLTEFHPYALRQGGTTAKDYLALLASHGFTCARVTEYGLTDETLGQILEGFPDSNPWRSINVCLFCIDIGRWAVIKESMNEAKFDALDHYSTSPLFTDAERAALDYVTELTTDKKVNPANIFGLISLPVVLGLLCQIRRPTQ